MTLHNGTDGQTDRQTDRVRRNMRSPPREEGRIIIGIIDILRLYLNSMLMTDVLQEL